jgi:hypothetical protein
MFLNSSAMCDLLTVLRIASLPTSTGEFVAQFITFSPILCKSRLRPRLRQCRNLGRNEDSAKITLRVQSLADPQSRMSSRFDFENGINSIPPS